MNSDLGSRGNVLFLILIAVVLFAALSYAVTQSSRGGGSGIDSEKLSLDVAQAMQQGALIKTNILRLYLIGGYDQIRFTASAKNDAGTYNAPDDSTPTGKTVGLFNGADGMMSQVNPPLSMMAAGGTENFFGWWYYYNHSMRVNGVDVGTALGDEVLVIQGLSEEACAEINRGLTGDSTIQAFTTGGTANRNLHWLWRDGTPSSQSTVTEYWDLPAEEGCFVRGTSHHYLKLIRSF